MNAAIDWTSAAQWARENLDPELVYGAGVGARIPCPIHGSATSGDHFTIYESSEGGARWGCHSRCGTGDVIAFIAATRHGYQPGTPYPTGEMFFAAVRSALDLGGRTVADFPRNGSTGRGRGGKAAKPFPPAEDLHALLEHAHPIKSDPDSCLAIGGRVRPGIGNCAQLAGLGLVHPLVRIVDRGWPAEQRPAWASAWSGAVLPLYDGRGDVVSLHNRPLRASRVKARNPKGYRSDGAVLANAPAVELLQGEPAAREAAKRHGVILVEGVPSFLAWSSWWAGPVLGLPGHAAPAAVLARIPRDAPVMIDTDPDAAGAEYLNAALSALASHTDVQWSARAAWYAGRIASHAPKSKADREAADRKVKAEHVTAAEADPRLLEPDEREGREGVIEGAGWSPVPAERRERAASAALARKGAATAGVPVCFCPYFEGAELPESLHVPPGYELHRDGSLWETGDGETPPSMLALEVPVVTRTLADSETRDERAEIAFRRRGEWRRAIIDRAIIATGGRDLAQALGRLGAPVSPKTKDKIAQWLSDLEAHNAHRVPHAIVARRSGWHEIEGEHVFALGGTAYGPDGKPTDRLVFDDAGDAAGITRNVRCGGDRTKHLELVKQLVTASDASACAIYAALAAPLLERIAAPSFGFHMVGPSSRGKTTALYGSGGVYGSPELRKGRGWLGTWESTVVGIEHRAAYSSDLPLCLDEAGLLAPERREEVAYMLIGGQGRARGAKAGGMRAMVAWSTVLVSTGEEELLRTDRARAGAQVRIVQARVEGLGAMGGEQVAALKMGLTQHYGFVGAAWIGRLLGVEDWRPHRERFEELARQFRAEASDPLTGRQAESFAALALAEELAAKWIGIPAGGAVARLASANEQRVEVVPEWRRGLEVLAGWIASEPGAWPVLEPDTGGGRAPSRSARVAPVIAGYREPCPLLSDVDEEAVYLLRDVVRERFAAAGLSLDTVAREWRTHGVLFADGKHLARKVSIAGERARVFVVRRSAVDGDAAIIAPAPDPGGAGPDGGPGGGADLTPSESLRNHAACPTCPTCPTSSEASMGTRAEYHPRDGEHTNAPHEREIGGAGGASGAPLPNTLENTGERPAPPPAPPLAPRRSQVGPPPGADAEFYDPPPAWAAGGPERVA